jgi:hypothetical protein
MQDISCQAPHDPKLPIMPELRGGLAGYVLGLLLSALLDLSTGAAIVCGLSIRAIWSAGC